MCSGPTPSSRLLRSPVSAHRRASSVRPAERAQHGDASVRRDELGPRHPLEHFDSGQPRFESRGGPAACPEHATVEPHRHARSQIVACLPQDGNRFLVRLLRRKPLAGLVERLSQLGQRRSPSDHVLLLQVERTAVEAHRRGSVESERPVARKHEELGQPVAELGAALPRRTLELERLLVVVDEDLGLVREAILGCRLDPAAAPMCLSARRARGIWW